MWQFQVKENLKLKKKLVYAKRYPLGLNSVTVNSERVIPLSVKIQNTNVTAEYKDGILNLTLPKAEEEKNKVVKVSLPEATA